MSDVDIDLSYEVNKSTKCYDYSCCHRTDIPTSDSDKAGKYGNNKCNMPLDGFKKMIDTINKLNTTSYMSFASMIFGGSANAYVPEYTNTSTVETVHKELLKYVRSKNTVHGIYYTLGPHDLYPLNYESFSAANDANLAAMDVAINQVTETKNLYSSIADNNAARTKFKEYGYYKVDAFIYNILIDDSSPPKAVSPNYNTDLVVLFLNTNACYNRNVALTKEAADVGNMLTYLDAELTAVKAQNKAAWIVGNVNPGSKFCNARWARRYNVLVEKHQEVVRMQLFGHEANEYFQLQFPTEGNRKPIGVTI